MQKDHIRDYATSAFRLYAAHGKPTRDQLRQRLYDEALEESKREIVHVRGISNPTQTAINQAEIAVINKRAELEDIEAVERTMTALAENPNSAVIAKVIEMVYFVAPKKQLKKGDISDRVHKAELAIPASERQIYRWLKQARGFFAMERGLRL